MKFGSICTGIGMMDLGLERAGMECAWQVEIDDFRSGLLARHWPSVKRYKDVYDVNGSNAKRVDLICGGIPCQPHSLAGYRRGGADRRDLWGEMWRLTSEIRPSYLLMENVPALLSSNNGEYFGTVLSDLAQGGYDAEWDCFSSAKAGGASIRERLFVLAYPQEDDRSRDAILQKARHLIEVCRKTQEAREAEYWGGKRSLRTSPMGGVRAFPHSDVFGVDYADPTELDIARMMAIGDTVDPVVVEAIGMAIMGKSS